MNLRQNKTVTVFGDSISKGVLYDGAKKKYSLRKNHGYAILNEHGFSVKNFSKMGATVNKGFEIMQSRLKSSEQSDIMILEFGGNDCDFLWSDIAKDPYAKHLPKTSTSDLEATYSKMIALAREKAEKIYIMNLLPLDADKYFEFISKFGSPENILIWLGDKYILYRFNEWYSHIVEGIAAKHNIELIDSRSEFLFRHDFKDLFCDDGIHPSENGYKILDNKLIQILK